MPCCSQMDNNIISGGSSYMRAWGRGGGESISDENLAPPCTENIINLITMIIIINLINQSIYRHGTCVKFVLPLPPTQQKLNPQLNIIPTILVVQQWCPTFLTQRISTNNYCLRRHKEFQLFGFPMDVCELILNVVMSND